MIDYLGCLLWGVTINTAGDILVQEYWSVFMIVSFLDQTPRRGICGSKGRNTRKLLKCLAMLSSAKAPAVDTAQPLCSASWVPLWVPFRRDCNGTGISQEDEKHDSKGAHHVSLQSSFPFRCLLL